MKQDKFSMRLKDDEHYWLKKHAADQSMSMVDMVKTALSIYFKILEAADIGMTVNDEGETEPEDYISNAVQFYSGFPSGFLRDVKMISDSLEIPIQTLIVNMLMKSSSYSFAWLQVFGTQPPNFLSEIRYDEKGEIITGPALLKQLTDEAIDHLKEVKVKLETGDETKKAVVISKKSMAVFQECLR